MNIGIVGLGLIGGSFGRTVVKTGKHTVYGFDVSEEVMLKGEMMRAYNKTLSPNNAKELDMLIIATRPEVFDEVVNNYLPQLKDGATVTDFCGTKRDIVALMEKYAAKYPSLNFVGGHPMADRELSGIEHSKANLFDKASMILVPVKTDIFVLEGIKAFYLSLGFSEVVITDAENHDSMIAFTSQLCHIVSNAFIKNKTAKKHFGYSAGSYKDLTRVARLDANMWTGLMMLNKDKLIPELSELIENLNSYKLALEKADEQGLKKLLSDGNERKIKIDIINSKKE
ncbi:MAG: prephenate dehydrogenase [Clostridia bacterium]|nr:prephenate dehydrogenase [Clostridia bacterium]